MVLTMFWLPTMAGKKAKFSKRVGRGKCKKNLGARDQRRYNGFRVMSIRVVTTLQCTIIKSFGNILKTTTSNKNMIHDIKERLHFVMRSVQNVIRFCHHIMLIVAWHKEQDSRHKEKYTWHHKVYITHNVADTWHHKIYATHNVV